MKQTSFPHPPTPPSMNCSKSSCDSPSSPMAPRTQADGSRSTKCTSGLATPSASACHTPTGACRGASAKSITATSWGEQGCR
eukprot:915194-Pelagomonas_calceolata.AAC.3